MKRMVDFQRRGAAERRRCKDGRATCAIPTMLKRQPVAPHCHHFSRPRDNLGPVPEEHAAEAKLADAALVADVLPADVVPCPRCRCGDVSYCSCGPSGRWHRLRAVGGWDKQARGRARLCRASRLGQIPGAELLLHGRRSPFFADEEALLFVRDSKGSARSTRTASGSFRYCANASVLRKQMLAAKYQHFRTASWIRPCAKRSAGCAKPNSCTSMWMCNALRICGSTTPR